MGEVTLQGRGGGRKKGQGLEGGWGPAHPRLLFLEPQNSIPVQLQLLPPPRAWAVSQSSPFSPPCRPCTELGPREDGLGGPRGGSLGATLLGWAWMLGWARPTPCHDPSPQEAAWVLSTQQPSVATGSMGSSGHRKGSPRAWQPPVQELCQQRTSASGTLRSLAPSTRSASQA
uniref:Uncharacterized protein n=1 Tax=Molossus molossus TaxID=27622 RepID=A0A7J8CZ37_MOLMO|nr:hypothetical protein HJG59_009432 [Molossus molossus]